MLVVVYRNEFMFGSPCIVLLETGENVECDFHIDMLAEWCGYFERKFDLYESNMLTPGLVTRGEGNEEVSIHLVSAGENFEYLVVEKSRLDFFRFLPFRRKRELVFDSSQTLLIFFKGK